MYDQCGGMNAANHIPKQPKDSGFEHIEVAGKRVAREPLLKSSDEWVRPVAFPEKSK